MRKILHVTNGMHFKGGGVPMAVQSIFRMLESQNYTQDILSVGENDDNSPKHIVNFDVKSKFMFSLKAYNWFKENYRNYDYIAFHCMWSPSILKIYKFCLNNKIKYYIHAHNSLDPFDIKKKYFIKKILGFWFINKVLINAVKIFCTSSLEKDRLFYFGKKSNNAVVIPLPVNYDANINGNRAKFRDKYALNSNQIVLLSVSRLDKKKGLDVFITSLNNYLEKNIHLKSKIQLFIAGETNTDYYHELKKMINLYNLNDNIHFLGLIAGIDKANAFLGADVFILPSKNENFGISIVEALQSSIPILITENVFIYKELFNDNFAPGWLCKANYSNLDNQIDEIMHCKSFENIKHQALSIGEQYKPQNLVEQYKTFYK